MASDFRARENLFLIMRLSRRRATPVALYAVGVLLPVMPEV